ncbi:hypothetical protein ACFS4T_11705 [Pseudomonas lini]
MAGHVGDRRYDCPMTSAEARHGYAKFRKSLLRANFIQLQNSHYVRHFPSMATARLALLVCGTTFPNVRNWRSFLSPTSSTP